MTPHDGCFPATFLLIPLASVGPGPLQDLQVASKSCRGTRFLIPFASVGPGPLQDLQVASKSCRLTRVLTPLAPVGPGPLQDLQVASSKAARVTRFLIPLASVGPGPLQDLQSGLLGLQGYTFAHPTRTRWPWPTSGPPGGLQKLRSPRFLIPLASVGPGPLQDLQVASNSCIGHTLTRPIRIRWHWPTSGPPGGPQGLQGYTFSYPIRSRWPWPTVELSGGPYGLLRTHAEHVSSFHLHPLALAHFRTSRWPPRAAWKHMLSKLHSHPFALSHFRVSR